MTERTVNVSFMSRPCLVFVRSLFCSFELRCTSVSSCIARFISAQAGVDCTQMCCCCSVIPRPLVNPLHVFRLLIRTCSVTRSVKKPAHKCSLSGVQVEYWNMNIHLFRPKNMNIGVGVAWEYEYWVFLRDYWIPFYWKKIHFFIFVTLFLVSNM